MELTINPTGARYQLH